MGSIVLNTGYTVFTGNTMVGQVAAGFGGWMYTGALITGMDAGSLSVILGAAVL